MKSINICGYDIPINRVSMKKLQSFFVDEDDEDDDDDLGYWFGVADLINLEIFVYEKLHENMLKKTLMHESIHILETLKCSTLSQIDNGNYSEYIASFVADWMEEIAQINLQINEWFDKEKAFNK